MRLQSLFCVSQGATPLFIASLKGHTDCVRLLLEHRADAAVRMKVCHQAGSTGLKLTIMVRTAEHRCTLLP